MKGEKKSLGGGFENPSDGWHLVEIDSDIAFSEKKDTKEATDRLVMRLLVIEDETEKGASTRQGFDLSTPGGREGLATIIYWCKLSGPIEKKYGLKDGPDLSEQEWGNKYLDIKSDDDEIRELSVKIVNAFIAKGPGKSLHVKTKSRKGSYTDRDTGEKVPTTYINLVDLALTSDADVKKEIKARLAGSSKPAPAAAAATPATPAGDDDEWPES